MNSIERGQAFRQRLQHVAQRTPWDERQCPHCGQHESWKHDRSTRRPRTLDGRAALTVRRS